MSLLIKALDSAEKTKQAEKNKQQEAQKTNEAPLELAPLESSQPEPQNVPAQDVTDTAASSEKLELTPLNTPKPANSLTLEEEAGLSSVPMAVKKYPKAKQDNGKPAASKEIVRDQVSGNPEVETKVVAGSIPSARTIANETNQKAAAKVFVANQATKSTSKNALFILGIAGALIIWLGLQGYAYLKPLLAPEVVAIKPAAPIINNIDASVAEPPVETTQPDISALADTAASPDATSPIKNEPADTSNLTVFNRNAVAPSSNSATASDENAANNTKRVNPATTLAQNETLIAWAEPIQSLDNSSNVVAERSSLKVTSKTPPPSIDPTLVSAYQAFTRGQDSAAQQLYRQVLQKDVRNIDALLGMAAIAQRQGRNADAAGWFQKVLEIEPRNTIAQSAMIDSQVESDSISTESRLKNMLALQPEAAHLYATLGNLYAEQNQWSLAQEAYFNASRYAPGNADYAFNLAISLDQLGKADLALKQYRRALELVNQTGATSPDRAQLETRIQALQ
jgi:tetratricopeptide (TPR) repeat protein